MLNYFVSYVILNTHSSNVYGNLIHTTEEELDLGENILILQDKLRAKFKNEKLHILNFKKLY